MRLDRLPEGVIVPLITPLDGDEALDEPALARLVEHVISGGVSGIFILGSSGEGPALPSRTKERLVAATCELVGERVPVLVGALGVGTRNVTEEARRLLRIGGDAAVVVAPYYFGPAQDEIAAHVRSVARALDAPTVVYNIPSAVKTNIEAGTLCKLATLPEIIAIKDSSGDMTHFQNLLPIRAVRPGFGLLQGAEGVVALSLIRGATGAVLGLANVAPALCCDLYAAARAGELARTWALQERLLRLWQIHSHGFWLSCLKGAVSELGICGPAISAPFGVAGPEDRQAIRNDMAAAGVLSS